MSACSSFCSASESWIGMTDVAMILILASCSGSVRFHAASGRRRSWGRRCRVGLVARDLGHFAHPPEFAALQDFCEVYEDDEAAVQLADPGHIIQFAFLEDIRGMFDF